MKRKFELSSAVLHILAMVFMLSDHIWGTWLVRNDWFTIVGRIAFPIFAFMIVEGFFHTHDLKKYMLRMLGFAIISEIPFDLMYAGTPLYLGHQNVMWTFLISLGALWVVDSLRKKGKWWLTVLVGILVTAAAWVLSLVTMLDFGEIGVITVMIFYVFRGRKWWCYVGQFLAMYWLNVEVMGGLCYIVNIFGHEFELVQQGFALLALIPIWLYRGKQGYHKKWFQYFCYAFYPAHALVLFLIKTVLTKLA